MRIALAQMNPTSGDINGNAAKILGALDEAARRGADLFVTPEMALPGYCIGDLVEDAGFLEANELAVQRIAEAARGITAVVGFIDFDAAARNDSGAIRKYNAAAVMRDGQVLQRAHKSLLPSYRYFDDKRFFVPAERREPVSIEAAGGPVRLGVSICEDHVGRVLRHQAAPRAGGERGRRPAQPERVPVLSGQAARARRHDPPPHPPAAQAARLHQHGRGGGQRQEHHPVRRREPGLRREREPARDRPSVRRRAPRRGRGPRRGPRRPGAAAAPRPRSGDLRRPHDGAAGLHAEDRFFPGHHRALRRHRFRARAGDCRRRPRPGPGRGVQHAVPLQQRHDQVDRRPARARVARSRTASFPSRRSTITSARSSRSTPIRS